MRSVLLATVLLAPTALLAQFPGHGAYKMTIQPVGQEATIPLTLTATVIGDSTAITLAQGPGQEIPVPTYFATRGGFAFGIGPQMSCNLVKGEKGWDGLCTDRWDAPMFTAHVPLTPEASVPPK